MAKAVTVFPRLKTERDELLTKLSEAPVEHAAALLDLYELAQVLHERGTLDFVRGLAGASDDVIGRLAEGMSTPESIRFSRNLIELTKLLSQVDPEQLRSTFDEGAKLLSSRPIADSKPPGLWAIFRRVTSRDGRRALALIAETLNEIGHKLNHRGEVAEPSGSGGTSLASHEAKAA